MGRILVKVLEEMEEATAVPEEAAILIEDVGGKGGVLISVKMDPVKHLEDTEKEVRN